MAEPTIVEAASASFRDTMRFIRRAVLVFLVAVFLLFAIGLGFNYAKTNHIDQVVTAHNAKLDKTLDAACVLIRSDPQLPQRDCPPVKAHR